MPTGPITRQQLKLATVALPDAYDDFILSRQAAHCSPATLEFYKYTAGRFVSYLMQRGLVSPSDVAAKHVREYLAELVSSGKSDNTIHDHARAIRTLLRFWHQDQYVVSPIIFGMPKVANKRLPSLTADQLNDLISACQNPRDKALVQFMADSGLRRAEVIALNWSDIDMSSGIVTVRRGKGGKARSAVVGAVTRRSLIRYRRTLADISGSAPVFQSRVGTRLTGSGLLLIFRRLSRRTGIHLTAHAFRRTFAILCLRANMDVLHLQALLGHSNLEMVQHYAQMVDEDLVQAHRASSPIDNLSRSAR